MATIIHTTNSRCVLDIKAGAANMVGAWFIYRAVRPKWPVRCVVYTDRVRGTGDAV